MTDASRPRVVVSPLEPRCGSGSEGSEGSKGSEGKVASPCGAGGYSRLQRRVVFAGAQGGDGPNGPRVVVSPPLAAMSIKSALRDSLPALRVILNEVKNLGAGSL